jgi:hypothetical protein
MNRRSENLKDDQKFPRKQNLNNKKEWKCEDQSKSWMTKRN